MNTQPKALRLADELDTNLLAVCNHEMKISKFPIEPISRAAAELRRLHEANAQLVDALTSLLDTARPVSNAAYNIGQSHPIWESQVYPAIEAFDAASLQAKYAIAKARGECND